MGLKRKYVRAFRRQFNQAPVWPQNEVLKLGEFGIYSNGKFTSFGNIFEELNLDVNDYLSDSQIVTSNALVHSQKTNNIVSSGQGSGGNTKVSVKVNFEGKREYLIQLFKFDVESISFRPDLINAMIENLEALKWRKKYRIVEQRIIAEHVKFAYNHARNATLELGAETQDAGANIASLDLQYENSSKVVAEAWADKGKGTPLVNLLRFKKSGVPDPVGPALYALEAGENDLITAADLPILVADNSDLEFELDNVEEEEYELEAAILANNGFTYS